MMTSYELRIGILGKLRNHHNGLEFLKKISRFVFVIGLETLVSKKRGADWDLLSADNELGVNLENVNIDAVEPEKIEHLLINKKFSLMQKVKENLDNGLNLTQGIKSDRMDRENVDDDDDLQSIASDRSAGIKRKRFDKNITDCKDCQQFCVELNLQLEKVLNWLLILLKIIKVTY
ncbi:hypothetical protein FQA39_LY08160 [Lamprigera yunnana]|nr:hypothetical protein FQA39_LY08160 [Lamprigera yunnana]